MFLMNDPPWFSISGGCPGLCKSPSTTHAASELRDVNVSRRSLGPWVDRRLFCAGLSGRSSPWQMAWRFPGWVPPCLGPAASTSSCATATAASAGARERLAVHGRGGQSAGEGERSLDSAGGRVQAAGRGSVVERCDALKATLVARGPVFRPWVSTNRRSRGILDGYAVHVVKANHDNIVRAKSWKRNTASGQYQRESRVSR
jgi:hypothetical protein